MILVATISWLHLDPCSILSLVASLPLLYHLCIYVLCYVLTFNDGFMLARLMVTSTDDDDRVTEYRAICLGRWNGRILQNPKEEKKAEAEGSDESSLMMMMKTLMMKTTLMMMTMQDNSEKDNDEKDNSAKHNNDDSDDVVDDKMDLDPNFGTLFLRHLEVPQSIQKYLKVPKSTSKCLEVLQSTQKFQKTPQSTNKYFKVTIST